MNLLRRFKQKCVPVRIGTFVLALLLFTSLGCRMKQDTANDAVFTAAEKLMSGYFEGDVATARQSLGDSIRSIEEAVAPLYPPRRAAFLSIQYARLYTFERRLGSKAAAELALIKARYWYIRRFELSVKHGHFVMNERLRQEMMDYDPDKIVKMIESLDKANTQAKGPKFSREP